MNITHEFDEYNNLTMIINYYGLTFKYQFSESYLMTHDAWTHLIKSIEECPVLEFSSGNVNSWNETLELTFPEMYKKLYIDALNKARNDPRISINK